MKRVLYLNNYMSPEAVKKRNNKEIFSQPANNKITGMVNALSAAGFQVTVLSSALVNKRSGKWFAGFAQECGGMDVVYCGILDLPLFNTLSSILSMYREIKRQHRKKQADYIIFYNYKPEVAWAAYLARRLLHIPATVEYEDGYGHVDGMGSFKSWIFRKTEKVVSRHVDSAILVTSKLEKEYSVPSTVVRGIVDADFYSRCRSYVKKKNEKFTVLYSGGLDPSRGIGILAESLKYFKADCRVVITGRGEVGSRDSRIDFKGFIPYNEVQQLMMQADVLLQCQLTGHSFGLASFPSKLFEYIATGNCIISSPVSDVRDFAGDHFLYFAEDDPRQLAERLEEAYGRWTEGTLENADMLRLCEENLPRQVGKRIARMWETYERDGGGAHPQAASSG